MSCDPLITDPFVFPRRADNRPGLSRIAYRIGRHADFREAIRRGIDAAPELAAWTHREPDDPAIAIAEGAAILGDILSFYQEHYLNEAFLRTAAWRDSVAELVRLTGYRLAPAIGGRATLALQARGQSQLTIPAGFPVRIDLAGDPAPADFRTDADLIAWPGLSRFPLYPPRSYPALLPAGATRLELPAGVADLKPGDRILLQPPEPGWTSSGTALSAQLVPQVVKLAKVTPLLDRMLLEIDTPLAHDWPAPVTAYRLGRSFRHFGQNAPPMTVTSQTDGTGKIIGASQSPTRFERHVFAGHDCTNTSSTIALPPALLPLDVEVPDLRIGMMVAVQTLVRLEAGGDRVALSAVRTIAGLGAGTIGFGNLGGPATLLTLDQPLVRQAMSTAPLGDVRDYRVLELTSPPLALRPRPAAPAGAFADGTAALRFWGVAAEAAALPGRMLHLAHPDGRIADLTCTQVSPVAAGAASTPRFWTLSFDRPPAPFTRADFDEETATVTVHGNLVAASQGRLEHEAILGNGDHRQSWQTFPLPESPLTYFLSTEGVPPQTPELQLWVGARLWARTDSFYAHAPADQVYIVREDAQGRSFVQFGDGRTGARLPSGIGNVVALYRTGAGAHGPARPGTTPTAGERPPGFDKVALAGIVAGGARAEPADKARDAAPGKVQGLGRIVSLRDFETETLSVPGVVTAAAGWSLAGGIPAVVLRVLLEAGREAEFAAVRATIAAAARCRGPDRFPLVVEQALPRFAFLDLSFALAGGWRRDDVEARISAALGLAGVVTDERATLFGLYARRLGQREHAARVEGIVQNVAGVSWCRVTAFGLLPANIVDPATADAPSPPRPRLAVLPCDPHELLRLSARHLTLTAVADAAAGGCA